MDEVPGEFQSWLRREAPRLAAIGPLEGFQPARTLTEELELFAKDARGIFGYDRLKEPVLDWLLEGPDGEPAVRAKLPAGTVEMRRWEITFTLLARPVATGPALLERALEKLLGRKATIADATARLEHGEGVDEVHLVDWQGSSAQRLAGRRFERAVAVCTGRTLLVALEPALAPARPLASLENPEVKLIDATKGRPKPPPPTAEPGGLLLPSGGRYPRRRPKARKKSAR